MATLPRQVGAPSASGIGVSVPGEQTALKGTEEEQ